MRGADLIPHGELMGFPALRLRIPREADPHWLIREFLRRQRPGIRMLQLDSEDWSTSLVDDQLAVFQGDPRTHWVATWVCRSASEAFWPASPLWYLHDCSSFLEAPQTLDTLGEALLRAPFVPRCAEIIVRSPAEGNLLPALLDKLWTNFDPERSAWLELPAGGRAWERAVAAASASSGQWGVRHAEA